MTAENSLTLERLKHLLHYDPLTGVFTNIAPRKKIRVGERSGTSESGRWVITIDRRHYPAARLAWFYMTGEWPPAQVDHKDRNPANDVWTNLRLATNKQNQENRSLDRRNKSGIKGVHWQSRIQRWIAQIRHDGKTLHLGCFAQLADAASARADAESRLFTHGVSTSSH